SARAVGAGGRGGEVRAEEAVPPPAGGEAARPRGTAGRAGIIRGRRRQPRSMGRRKVRRQRGYRGGVRSATVRGRARATGSGRRATPHPMRTILATVLALASLVAAAQAASADDQAAVRAHLA